MSIKSVDHLTTDASFMRQLYPRVYEQYVNSWNEDAALREVTFMRGKKKELIFALHFFTHTAGLDFPEVAVAHF